MKCRIYRSAGKPLETAMSSNSVSSDRTFLLSSTLSVPCSNLARQGQSRHLGAYTLLLETPGDQCFALIYPDNIDMDNFIRVYSPYDLHGFRGYSQGCGGRDG